MNPKDGKRFLTEIEEPVDTGFIEEGQEGPEEIS